MFIVALPFGVLHGGYWGILAMVGISHICCHTGKILVECLYEPCDEGGGQEPLKVRNRSRFFFTSWAWNHILMENNHFSIYHVIVRPTKIINHLLKELKFWFQWNLFDFFPLTDMSLGDQFKFLRFFEAIFGGSLDDVGRSENDMV